MPPSIRGLATPHVILSLLVTATAGSAFLAARARAHASAPTRESTGGADSTPSTTGARSNDVSPLSNGAGHLPPRVTIATCSGASANPSAASTPVGDARARAGAQRGLRFVAKNACEWQSERRCYGCHVQAVTLEALTVGRKNQYDVPQGEIDAMLDGLLDLRGGAHQKNGLAYEQDQLREPAKAFGGAAFAHYDAAIDGRVRKELLDVAAQLAELQAEDGHVGAYLNGPVAVGPLQTTTQALQTWRQAYERSADERWLAPIRRAESYLQSQAAHLTDMADTDPQQTGYAIIGLVSAGASRSEAVVQTLAKRLVQAQGEDGAWGGSALVTGASLYALRLSGMNDGDAPIAHGTRFLLAHQGEDGGWSHGGSARGEAMWAVLGLVTLDVVTVDVAGLDDGAHVQGTPILHASARDNGGGEVRRIDVAVDDVTLKSACGGNLDFALDSRWLGDGPHAVDVIATNARGQTSRRRLELYAGAYYLTEIGARFEDGGTSIALRDLAPADIKRKIELHVFATNGGARGDEVFQATRDGAQGPMRFFWNGKDAQGRTRPTGAYVAELRFVTPDGKIVQRAEAPFVHDTPAAQQAKYAEVAGRVQSDLAGQDGLANTEVELLDKNGNVVQRVKSTAQGSYRFRNVEGGEYKVRVKKDGFADNEANISAAPAAPAASATFTMKAR